jgi:glycosyltransferase involved in cell wall biosynthesis
MSINRQLTNLQQKDCKKDISILFATYTRSDILVETLESFCSLNAKGLDWEIIVVDNADDRETWRTVEKFHDRLTIKYLVETNKGKNSALNSAIPDAIGKLLVFTDDDVIADTNWLIEIWEGAQRWPKHMVFGGRILPKLPTQEVHIPMDRHHPLISGAYVIADWDLKEGVYSPDKVWGPNMAVRSEIFQKGWRFNPDIGPSGNNYIMGSETEFVIRLAKAGYEPVYLPKALVYHQIRSEQLNSKWLYKRAFKIGRSSAFFKGVQNKPVFWGMPKHLLRKTIYAFIAYIYMHL